LIFLQNKQTERLILKVKVKKLNDNAVVPCYAKRNDAGMDITAIGKRETEDYVEYTTGLAFEVPEGYVGLLLPRSSNCKKSLCLANSVGVLDSGYRGEVLFRFKRVIGEDKHYEVGDRVGQIIILPYPQIEFELVENLSDSDRGDGGFGSSGN
jgi:dUTP pyrophosphatase